MRGGLFQDLYGSSIEWASCTIFGSHEEVRPISMAFDSTDWATSIRQSLVFSVVLCFFGIVELWEV